MNQQLALAIHLHDEKNLSNFCWTANPLVKQCIDQMLSEDDDQRLLYVWSGEGQGKTHLLQGCCHALNREHSAMYLPLNLIKDWGPSILEGLEEHRLIAIDDIEAIAGNAEWEIALFHLYNRIRDNGHSRLIISGMTAPTALPINLPDLQSRLTWGLVLQIQPLSDEDKLATLQLRASQRGFSLPAIVGQFILKRCTRTMHDLDRIIDRLDEASLAHQRKITIPFVKTILNI